MATRINGKASKGASKLGRFFPEVDHNRLDGQDAREWRLMQYEDMIADCERVNEGIYNAEEQVSIFDVELEPCPVSVVADVDVAKVYSSEPLDFDILSVIDAIDACNVDDATLDSEYVRGYNDATRCSAEGLEALTETALDTIETTPAPVIRDIIRHKVDSYWNVVAHAAMA